MNDEMKTLELECGVTLELKSVNRMMLSDFFGGITSTNGKVSPKSVGVKSFNKLMRYICGWGVTNEMPAEEIPDYEMWGGVRQQRSAWVREIATEPELSQLMAQIMILTIPEARKASEAKKQQAAQQEPQTVDARDELEKLRARVAELESEKAEDGQH